jgi:hypothetical protein
VEWLQLQADSGLGYALERGFSGSPVWDEELGAVIGIVVTKDRRRGDQGDPRVGFAIPMDVVEHFWPGLSPMMPGSSSPPTPPIDAAEQRQLEKLLHIHERNVALLQEQVARFAGLAPVHLLTQLQDEQDQVLELHGKLNQSRGQESRDDR